MSQNKMNVDESCEELLQLCRISIDAKELWVRYTEVFQLLERIRVHEPRRVIFREREDAINDFLHWMERNQASFHGVDIAQFPPYGLGLRAAISFRRGDVIIGLPKDLIFDADAASPEIESIKSHAMLQDMPQITLAIALMIERHKENSKWKAYLDILPKEFSTVMYMHPDELWRLRRSPTLEPALRHCINIARQYCYFRKLLFCREDICCGNLKDHFTYEEYRWAVSTVMTRQNEIPDSSGSKKINCLIPMWDLCNHEEGEITTVYNIDLNRCECYAMKNFEPGEQIRMYYGPRTNAEFFVHAGFVYSNNQEDSYKLRLGISRCDRLRDKKIEALTKLGLSSPSSFLLKPRPNLMSQSLLRFSRVFCMTEAELDDFLANASLQNATECHLTLNSEVDKRVIEFLSYRLKLILHGYVSDLNEETLKEQEDISCNYELISQLISAEIDILKRIISIFENSEFRIEI